VLAGQKLLMVTAQSARPAPTTAPLTFAETSWNYIRSSARLGQVRARLGGNVNTR